VQLCHAEKRTVKFMGTTIQAVFVILREIGKGNKNKH
jgi:hypothetical protein